MRRISLSFLITMVLLSIVTVLFTVTIMAQDPGASPPRQQLPWWGGVLAVAGLNLGIGGLKIVVPKIPPYLLPLVNIGLSAGITWLGGIGIQVPPEVLTTLAISGTAALTHGVVKHVRSAGPQL